MLRRAWVVAGRCGGGRLWRRGRFLGGSTSAHRVRAEYRRRVKEEKHLKDDKPTESVETVVNTFYELRPAIRTITASMHPDRVQTLGEDAVRANKECLQSFLGLVKELESRCDGRESGKLDGFSTRCFLHGSEKGVDVNVVIRSCTGKGAWLEEAVRVVNDLQRVLEVENPKDFVCAESGSSSSKKRLFRSRESFHRRKRESEYVSSRELLLRNLSILSPIVQGKIYRFPDLHLDQESPIPQKTREAIATAILNAGDNISGSFVSQHQIDLGAMTLAKALVDHFDACWGFHAIWAAVNIVFTPHSNNVVSQTMSLYLRWDATPRQMATYIRDALPTLINTAIDATRPHRPKSHQVNDEQRWTDEENQQHQQQQWQHMQDLAKQTIYNDQDPIERNS